MKRSRRIIFNLLTLLSLVLCVAVAGLWVRSRSLSDFVYWYRPFGRSNSTVIIHFGKGLMAAGALRIDDAAYNHSLQRFTLIHNVPIAPSGAGLLWNDAIVPNRLGFGIGGKARLLFPHRPYFQYGYWSVVAPLWSFSLTFALMPVLWVWKQIRSKARGPGLCAECGYDLRATPKRCPECGAISAKANG